jgi:hypothetical protein
MIDDWRLTIHPAIDDWLIAPFELRNRLRHRSIERLQHWQAVALGMVQSTNVAITEWNQPMTQSQIAR